MTRTLKLLSHNAIRLHRDARLLFDAQRYPTSLSLSLLSMEESGKFFLMRRKRSDSDHLIVKKHVSKQYEALTWLVTEETILAFFEVLREFGFEHKPFMEMTEQQRRWTISPDGVAFDTKLRNGEITNIVMSAVNHRVKELRLLEDLRRVSEGEINKLKQLGLYLDTGSDEQEFALPQSISQNEALWWLRKAERAAELTTIYSTDHGLESDFATAPFHKLLQADFRIPF